MEDWLADASIITEILTQNLDAQIKKTKQQYSLSLRSALGLCCITGPDDGTTRCVCWHLRVVRFFSLSIYTGIYLSMSGRGESYRSGQARRTINKKKDQQAEADPIVLVVRV